MSMQPLQLAFYKGMGGNHGALQFNMQRPHFYIKNPGDDKRLKSLKNYEGKFIPTEWKKDYPDLTKDELTSREGALFMEITSAAGRNVYDWNSKIIMALSITDLGKMLTVLEGGVKEVKIMHDPGAKTTSEGKVQKFINITSPQGLQVGAMFSVSQKDANGDKTQHTVPLSGDEVKVLATCIRAVIPATLGWV